MVVLYYYFEQFIFQLAWPRTKQVDIIKAVADGTTSVLIENIGQVVTIFKVGDMVDIFAPSKRSARRRWWRPDASRQSCDVF